MRPSDPAIGSVRYVSGQKYRYDGDRLRADARSSTLLPGSVLVTERVAAYYSQTLPAVVQGTLADLGCGTAPLRPLYARLTDKHLTLDWPASVHDIQIDAFADLGRGVPLRSGSIDTVLVSDVLEHLPHPGDFLEECHRILRDGGKVVGNVPFLYGLHEEPHDYFRYTEHGLRRMFADAGFADTSISVVGGGLDILVDTVAKVLSRMPLVGGPVARVAQVVWVAVSSPPLVRRALGELERRLPIGYGFVATTTGRRRCP